MNPIEYRDGVLAFVDQTLLPARVRHVETREPRDVAAAIRRLAIRGAPLIGIAGAYALALAARQGRDLHAVAQELAATRPTAVNLRWALDRTLAAADPESEALKIHEEQIASDARMGEFGAALLPPNARVLTHCNAGSFASGGIGTALGVIKTAHRLGNPVSVLVDETRPLLQGARLTAWELASEDIPYEIIVDGAAAGLIARGFVDAVIVGADRIAANGDVANKVGTYALALAASAGARAIPRDNHEHGAGGEVPLYVVAPASTIDLASPDGSRIKIEDRTADEVLSFAGTSVAPHGAAARNPAFDVTPAALVTAIVTERGILRPPYAAAIADALNATAVAR